MTNKTFIAQNNRICTSRVFTDDRIIATVGKGIIPKETLTRTDVTIHIDKSTGSRVIIAGLEVIEAGINIVVIAAITDGVGFCHTAGGIKKFAVRVVLVRG